MEDFLPATPDDAIYQSIETPDGPRMLPSDLASGPWNPNHQHGGPVSALLTRALESLDSPQPMRLARISVEMFRGVPLLPIRVESKITRAGRRVQGVEASLFDGDVEVARATGLRMRIDSDLAELGSAPGRDPATGEPPIERPKIRGSFEGPAMPGFIRAVDIAAGAATACGVPANVWTRLRCRFMEGEETAPIVRLAALVDIASGTGNPIDYSKFTSINPDLSIHVLREPRSDWLALRATTLRSDDGMAQSFAAVYDLEGPVAHVQASILLSRR